jgi:hypothetical protein
LGILLTLVASPADEARFQIGQPHIIGLCITIDRDRMAATIIGTIEQQATHACFAHFGEGNFLRAGGGGPVPMIAPIRAEVKPLGAQPDWTQAADGLRESDWRAEGKLSGLHHSALTPTPRIEAAACIARHYAECWLRTQSGRSVKDSTSLCCSGNSTPAGPMIDSACIRGLS